MTEHQRPCVVAAPDSFKGSCSAADAAEAMLRGARAVFGDAAEYIALPLADGGEGTLDTVAVAWGVSKLDTQVTDALGRPRTAQYASNGSVALIEAAEANGLPHVLDQPLQPLDAETRGIGNLVHAALGGGADEIVLCIGGSATSDAGTGMLSALGVGFLSAKGSPVLPGARHLGDIVRIDMAGVNPRVLRTKWRIAVDVENPLCGPDGAAHTFGPQKGANDDDVAVIEAGMQHFATVLAAHAGVDPDTFRDGKGFGAAGGIAASCAALLNAELESGADLVAQILDAATQLQRASVVLTGEGRLDAQSLSGKVTDLVRRSAPLGAPLIVVAGSVSLTAAECREAGITAAFSISTGPASLEELVADVLPRIEDTTAHACALLTAAGGLAREIDT